ncbi:hypothetical protein RchiOBHm_Chr5g0053521 [Rosa chinensis]|uniref:Uncharacterized protein n=1 Tax=Rosa chinensis TaxID=74649 RepID=A0A2P6QFY5_ROSCH|nr:hypothetical protein RchiOBHm_Chr5g0053521 [Rosa chinensis]
MSSLITTLGEVESESCCIIVIPISLPSMSLSPVGDWSVSLELACCKSVAFSEVLMLGQLSLEWPKHPHSKQIREIPS